MKIADALKGSINNIDVKILAAHSKHIWMVLIQIFIFICGGLFFMLRAVQFSTIDEFYRWFLFSIGLIAWTFGIHIATEYITVHDEIAAWSKRVQSLLHDLFTSIDEALWQK